MQRCGDRVLREQSLSEPRGARKGLISRDNAERIRRGSWCVALRSRLGCSRLGGAGGKAGLEDAGHANWGIARCHRIPNEGGKKA